MECWHPRLSAKFEISNYRFFEAASEQGYNHVRVTSFVFLSDVLRHEVFPKRVLGGRFQEGHLASVAVHLISGMSLLEFTSIHIDSLVL